MVSAFDGLGGSGMSNVKWPYVGIYGSPGKGRVGSVSKRVCEQGRKTRQGILHMGDREDGKDAVIGFIAGVFGGCTIILSGFPSSIPSRINISLLEKDGIPACRVNR